MAENQEVVQRIRTSLSQIFPFDRDFGSFYLVDSETNKPDFSKTLLGRLQEIKESKEPGWGFQDVTEPSKLPTGHLCIRLIGSIEVFEGKPTGRLFVHQTQGEMKEKLL